MTKAYLSLFRTKIVQILPAPLSVQILCKSKYECFVFKEVFRGGVWEDPLPPAGEEQGSHPRC